MQFQVGIRALTFNLKRLMVLKVKRLVLACRGQLPLERGKKSYFNGKQINRIEQI